MRLTYAPLGTPGMCDTTLVHVLPLSRDICKLPSSVPPHKTPAFTYDSAIAVRHGQATTPSFRESVVLSGVLPRIGCLSRSCLVVRSSPNRIHVSPRSVDLKR